MTSPATNSAYWLIKMAMKDAGLLAKKQEPTSEDFADNLIRLNDMVNLWQTQGLKLFLVEDLTVPIVAGQSVYTLGPSGTIVMTKPTRVVDAYYVNVGGARRPLIPLAWADWVRLSQVTQVGALTNYFVDKQQLQLSVTFWPVPDSTIAAGEAHLIIQQQATNAVKLTDTMVFPLEWGIALRWGLADELCTGQPQAIMDRCERRAGTYRQALEDWDVEDAPTQMQPDQRLTWSTGSFQ